MISVLESINDVVVGSDQVLGVGCNRKSCKVRYIGEGSLQDSAGPCRHPVGKGNGSGDVQLLDKKSSLANKFEYHIWNY